MGSSSSKTRRFGSDGGANGSFSSSAPSPSSSFSSSYSSLVAGSTTSGGRRRERGKSRSRIFRSSCLGSSSTTYYSDDDQQVSDHRNEARGPRLRQTESQSDEVKLESYQTVKVGGSDDLSSISSNVQLGDWTHRSRADNMTRVGGSSSQSFSGRSLNHSGRFLSRFSFVPESVSLRLSRAASVGSSRAYPSSPTNFTISNVEDDLHLHRRSYGLVNRNEHQQSANLNSSCPSSSSIRSHNDDSAINLVRNGSVSSPLSQNTPATSAQDLADNDSERIRPDNCLPTFGSRMDVGNLNRRLGDHRNGTREPVDRNVRFSRTLSVGRLRDRVLRRSSFSDMTLSPLQNERTAASNENPVNSLMSSPYPLPTMHNHFDTSQNIDVETSHVREARRHDLLEHRSNFLERRRRIRSQVRALQHLGSRFENLSGHDRYCILSGQHRTGRCSCHIGIRDSNSNDDGVARGSISRIVMLAEALFEVLDEIHQQSVALSSRPSVSPIGSVPAPAEVVESLPVKAYTKKTKFETEEAAQCYICLVEYDEGDDVRILPCHHEFHKKCIDKWLKEIHRVCPLCRGDVCKTDSLSAET